MKSRPVKRFLVMDVDDCSFSLYSKRDDLLSTSLIQKALHEKYDGFYLCTHRTYRTIDSLKKYALLWGAKLKIDAEKIKNNFPTYKVKENFENATRLPCKAVSIMDDVTYRSCGIAYQNVLMPFEKDSKLPAKNAKFVSFRGAFSNWWSKNRQLTQIANHAVQNYPNTSITIDYVDNSKSLCKEAVKLKYENTLPPDVHLNVYYHKADKEDAPVEAVDDSEDDLSDESSMSMDDKEEQDIFYDCDEGIILELGIFKTPLLELKDENIREPSPEPILPPGTRNP